ncbi:origin recognition complex subunit 5 [Toxorhynchites rutilus septentrionalis]|uniref:origin recognition complex subunit 5 n=1 Tax=Toxorhynchites rutilus septentrionalis TaxID=329112 RepID=UPI00247AC68E|nr:origin recognition complex subunit 5 [Toxorhynchites rutilus septentrionalis]
MEQAVEAINARYPCREDLVRKLYQLYGDGGQFPPALYLYGHTSTGKSSIVQALLHRLAGTKYAILNAIECYTNKILFESIVNELEGHVLSVENGYSSLVTCDCMKDFVGKLQELDATQNYIIVLENAERVRDMDHNVLPMLLRLPEVTGLNISVILVSDLPFAKYYIRTGLSPIVRLFVPEYSKKDILAIMLMDFETIREQLGEDIKSQASSPSNGTQLLSEDETAKRLKILSNLSSGFYENYLSIFLNVFFKVCRDLKELQLVSFECFQKYCEPVLDGSISPDDVTKLWRHISKTMKLSLSTIYMRMGHVSRQEQSRPAADQLCSESVEQLQTMRRMAQNLELPFYAKYLLIAAYLASHNAAKEDKRLFMKNHGKQKKRLQSVNAKARVSEKMATQLGPKSFTVDRLLAIFYAILDEKVGLTCNLLAQISTLIHLKFLIFASGEGSIMDGNGRLQCTVGMDFIMHIGKMVGFNVRQYLCDFF